MPLTDPAPPEKLAVLLVSAAQLTPGIWETGKLADILQYSRGAGVSRETAEDIATLAYRQAADPENPEIWQELTAACADHPATRYHIARLNQILEARTLDIAHIPKPDTYEAF